jgi:hypothetical protein
MGKTKKKEGKMRSELLEKQSFLLSNLRSRNLNEVVFKF